MWVYSKHRGEHDFRFLMNLDLCSRINLTHLGEKWFVEVTLGSETIPIAQVTSQEEAERIMGKVFEGLRQGHTGVDLEEPASSREHAPAPV